MISLLKLAVTSTDIGIPKVDANDTTIEQILSSVFLMIGSLAVFFLLVGAARYATANGEQAKIAQAKNAILYALVGVVLSAMGFTVVQFIIGKVNGNL